MYRLKAGNEVECLTIKLTILPYSPNSTLVLYAPVFLTSLKIEPALDWEGRGGRMDDLGPCGLS